MPRKKPKTSNEYLALSRCVNCRHWMRLDDSEQMPAEDVLGECLRYPPKVLGLTEDGETVQGLPIVEARHYCGEHGPQEN